MFRARTRRSFNTAGDTATRHGRGHDRIRHDPMDDDATNTNAGGDNDDNDDKRQDHGPRRQRRRTNEQDRGIKEGGGKWLCERTKRKEKKTGKKKEKKGKKKGEEKGKKK